MALLADILACPRCDAGLRRFHDDTWGCDACGLKFPSLLGIPCLFPDAMATLNEWRARLNFLLDRLAEDAASLQAELQSRRLKPLARERLVTQNRARLDQAKRLKELLAPLRIQFGANSVAAHVALQTRLPPDQGLITYYPNIHRDWAWGDEENVRAASLVGTALAGGTLPDTLLVLGAGAGRLAYDLHQQAIAGQTIALDFNPLLALVAQRAFAGETLQLWEFPLAPRTFDDHAVLRELGGRPPARDGLHLVLADALRPPFAAGSINAVVTPWLVDILPEDFAVLATRINQLLPDGGRWVCFGSVAFAQPESAGNYSLEEMLDLIAEAGFAAPEVSEDEIPYMCSPASRHGRRELVVTITATRERAVPRPARPKALPDWLVAGTQPVPLTRATQVQAAASRIHGYVLGLIDGRRSIRDIARLLEEQRLMNRAEAEATVRQFLIKMHDEGRNGGRL
jgi:uncharacterized protein YbaR (Trm112 family)